jgi:hypothetical protein
MRSLPFVTYIESLNTYGKSAPDINVCSTLLYNFCSKHIWRVTLPIRLHGVMLN